MNKMLKILFIGFSFVLIGLPLQAQDTIESTQMSDDQKMAC